MGPVFFKTRCTAFPFRVYFRLNMTPIAPIEVTITRLLKQQDPEALRLIHKHYGRALMGVIGKIVQHQALAEDALQESLVKMWRAADSFDPEKGRLFTWMLNICRRTAIDKTRSKDYRIEREIQNETDFVHMAAESSDGIKPDRIGLRELVDQLDPVLRQAVDMVYFQDRTHEEAAKELELPLGTLKTRVRNGIKELRKIFST